MFISALQATLYFSGIQGEDAETQHLEDGLRTGVNTQRFVHHPQVCPYGFLPDVELARDLFGALGTVHDDRVQYLHLPRCEAGCGGGFHQYLLVRRCSGTLLFYNKNNSLQN